MNVTEDKFKESIFQCVKEAQKRKKNKNTGVVGIVFKLKKGQVPE